MIHMKYGNPSYVLTRTPLRVSFAGGGTDLAAFYDMAEYGAVLSTAINKYIYVTVKRHGSIFNEAIRLNYSKSEQVQAIDQIENDIARLKMILTTPFCPYGPAMIEMTKAKAVEGLNMPVTIEMGMDMWDFSMMEDPSALDWGMYA